MIQYKISNIFSVNTLINKILVNGSVRMVLPQKQGLRRITFASQRALCFLVRMVLPQKQGLRLSNIFTF